MLVAKPDQLIKRRGKLGLIKVKTDLNGATSWIQERLGKDQQVQTILITIRVIVDYYTIGKLSDEKRKYEITR